jgi:hypothetical protein
VPASGLIAQCHRLTNGNWVVTEIFAKGNGRVEPASAAVLRQKLQSLGIPALSPGEMYPRTQGVRSLLGAWDGVGRHLGFDDDADEDLEEVTDEFRQVEDAA